MDKQLGTQHFRPSKEDSKIILRLQALLGIDFPSIVRMGLRKLRDDYQKGGKR
jgi:hypothetical protein